MRGFSSISATDNGLASYNKNTKTGPSFAAGYGGANGEVEEQTTEAAAGTRVLTGIRHNYCLHTYKITLLATGKEQIVGTSGGVSGAEAIASTLPLHIRKTECL